MNGARITCRRMGYFLAALAALLLVAASPGTATAQVTVTELVVDVPRSVAEGSTAKIAVTIKGTVESDGENAEEQDVTVTLTGLGMAGTVSGVGYASAAEDHRPNLDRSGDPDFSFYPRGSLKFEFPANTSVADPATQSRTYSFTGSIEMDTNNDRDAEDEGLELTATVVAGTQTTVANADDITDTARLIISDDEAQSYVLGLARRETPVEGVEFTVELVANPPHADDGIDLVFQVVDEEGVRDRGYTIIKEGDTEQMDVRLGEQGTSRNEETPTPDIDDDAENEWDLSVKPGDNDGNRVMDSVTLEAHSGSAGSSRMVASLDFDVRDVNSLPESSGITAVARDAKRNGAKVDYLSEGGDPVYLTVSVDRGTRGATAKTLEELTIEFKPSDAAQAADYEISPSRITLEEVAVADGEQSSDVEIELMARSDEDVGMEELMLDIVVSGAATIGTETATGTFTISIMDNTMKKIEPKSEADAYPAILEALEGAAGEDGLNPGESFMVMASDLFTVADGYEASYKVSVEGGAVSVSASSESITVTGNEAGESKVTVTGTAKMAASSFLPEQTMSDVAHITFAVMVVDEETEPVPALPLFGQLLLALFMMAGGARLYRRRQG